MEISIEHKDSLKVLGLLFKEEREAKGYSLRGISRSINVSHTVISDIENAKIHPNTDTLRELYEAIDLSLCVSPSMLGEMRTHFNGVTESIYYMKEAQLSEHMHVLLANETTLNYSPLRVEYMLIKAMYLLYTQGRDDGLLEILESIKSFMSPKQSQIFSFIKGLHHALNKQHLEAITHFKNGLDDTGDAIVHALVLYYISASYHRAFQNHMSIYYANEAANVHSKHNNMARKVEADLLKTHKLIDVGAFDDAQNILSNLKQALRMTYGEKAMQRRMSIYQAYLHYSKNEYETALRHIMFDKEDPNYRNHLFLSAMAHKALGNRNNVLEALEAIVQAGSEKGESDSPLSAVARLFKNALGAPVSERTLRESINTILDMPYGFPSIHQYYFAFDLIIDYCEKQEDFEFCVSVIRRIHEINKNRELHNTRW